jgi:hypothetical protein
VSVTANRNRAFKRIGVLAILAGMLITQAASAQDLNGRAVYNAISGLPTFMFQLHGRSQIKTSADLKGKVLVATQPAASSN